MRERLHLARRGLLKRATRDFELARKYKDAKELVTASLLYNSAVEKVLRALVMERTRRKPPEKASMGYLAEKAGLPEDIYSDIAFFEDEMAEVLEEEHEIESRERYDFDRTDEKEYNNVLNKGTVVRRLINYAEATR